MRVDDALELIRHAFVSGRPGQAYMLVGPPRGEAGTLALRIVQMLFCTEKKFEGCGKCRACLACESHKTADVAWVESAMKSRVISVDQMRAMQKQMLQTSYAGGWKVCVLLGADRMNPAGANAFLKTLEEPPARSLFLLVTDSPQMLLPTIVSRCQRVDVQGSDRPALDPEWRDQVIEVLQSHRPGVISGMSTGERLGRVFRAMKSAAAETVEAQLDDEVEESKAVIEARTSARYREMRTELLRFLEGWYRDMMVLVVGGDESVLYNPEWVDVLRERSKKLTVRQVLSYVKMIENVARQLERNMQESEVLGYWMGRLP